MEKRGCQIESIGRYLPEKILTTQDIVSNLNVPGIKKLELLTGIKERRICSEGEDSFTLAVGAALDCLKYSIFRAEEIELIIYCSITKYKGGLKHFYEPSMAIYIKNYIGAIAANCFDISNACAGMLTGMYVADALISSGQVKNCMLVSGEYISSLIKNDAPGIKTLGSKGLASLTLGDAGSAVILQQEDNPFYKIKQDNFITLGEYCSLCTGIQSRKGPGASMKTDTRKIHEVSIRQLPELISDSLKSMNLCPDDIDFILPHQTSRSAIRDGIKYLKEKTGHFSYKLIDNLDLLGNTASTTHFLALYQMLISGKLRKNSRIMLLSIASGLVLGITVYTLNNISERYGNNN